MKRDLFIIFNILSNVQIKTFNLQGIHIISFLSCGRVHGYHILHRCEVNEDANFGGGHS